MESAERQPDSLVPPVSITKPGCRKRSPDPVGHAAVGPTGAAAATPALPPSPFSLVALPSVAAGGRPQVWESVVGTKTIDSRHSGGGAATDSASSDATQLAAVHAAQGMGLSPDSRSRSGRHGAAANQAVLAGIRQWDVSALPDGLSGLLESRKPERTVDGGHIARHHILDCAVSQQGTASSQRRSATDPTTAVVATATAALNLAAERLLVAGGQRQLAALSQGSAGLAAAAATAAHLVLQGASPSEAADKILAMVLLSEISCCTCSCLCAHGLLSTEQPSSCRAHVAL